MLVVIQFPICDARAFTPSAETRLPVPDWPFPSTGVNRQFVRRFGEVVRRRGGPDRAWTDEVAFGRAGRALRFPNLGRRVSMAGEDGSSPGPSQRCFRQCVFRRIWSDGTAVTRVEVGMLLRHTARHPLAPVEFERLLEDTLNLPVSTPGFDAAAAPVPLVIVGRHLARVYARSTMRHGSELPGSSDPRLVESGEPLVIVDVDSRDRWYHLPRLYRVVEFDADASSRMSLAFAPLHTRWGDVSCWFSSSETTIRRSLRLCLLRLHAEQEVLDLVLKQLRRGDIRFEPGTPAGDRLEDYLNRATRAINRQSSGGIDQSAVRAAFDAILSVQPAAERENLALRHSAGRRQVWQKVADYERRRSAVQSLTVQGDWIMNQGGQVVKGPVQGDAVNIVQSQVTDSFKRFEASHPDRDEVARAVEALHDQVRVLVERLAQDQPEAARDVAENLEAFTEEAARQAPRRRPLSAIGDALIAAVEVAKGAADVAGPVASAVQAVLAAVGH